MSWDLEIWHTTKDIKVDCYLISCNITIAYYMWCFCNCRMATTIAKSRIIEFTLTEDEGSSVERSLVLESLRIEVEGWRANARKCCLHAPETNRDRWQSKGTAWAMWRGTWLTEIETDLCCFCKGEVVVRMYHTFLSTRLILWSRACSAGLPCTSKARSFPICRDDPD